MARGGASRPKTASMTARRTALARRVEHHQVAAAAVEVRQRVLDAGRDQPHRVVGIRFTSRLRAASCIACRFSSTAVTSWPRMRQRQAEEAAAGVEVEDPQPLAGRPAPAPDRPAPRRPPGWSGRTPSARPGTSARSAARGRARGPSRRIVVRPTMYGDGRSWMFRKNPSGRSADASSARTGRRSDGSLRVTTSSATASRSSALVRTMT